MQIVETLNEGLKRAYTITIPAKDLDARVDAEVKKIAPQVRMPGFRPGKVPANLIRKMHGESIHADALNATIQESVDKAIRDNNLRPAIQPSVDLNEDYAAGKDAEVKVSLEVLPQVPTPSIDSITLERLTVEPAEEAVTEALQRIADGQKSYDAAPKSYKAKEGDQVVIDFEGKVDGVPFEGGKGEGMAVVIGSGQLIPGFEDQLVGLKANDEAVINVTFPENYGAKDLAGKAATFDIIVGEVKKPGETKLDDDFAKSLGLESLEQLTGLIKGQLEQELNGLTRTHMKRRLLDQLAANHDFEVPPSMVEAEFNQIWAQLEQEAAQEEDVEAARAEMEKDRDEYHAIAVRRVRLGLLLSEIGQANGVEVSAQEMNMLIAQAAQQYRQEDRQRFAEYIRNTPMAAAQLRAPLYEDKVVDFLFDKATITDRKVTREELEAAIEADEDGHVHGPDCGHDHAHDEKPKAKKAAPKKAAVKKDAEAAPAEAAEDAKPAKKAPAKKAAAKKEEAPAETAEAAEKPAKKAPAKKAAAKKA
ncbi:MULTISPECIES: trigger factor [Pseudomonadota]|uniref:trigger factor n=2 Tax=Pseudomonadota TaxID=1224 RepID=UPI00076A2685|nr:MULTISPECIES: trigger factor [Pseudomonadota]MAF60100.1 trigger factor [Blastomonas sp.]